LNFIFWKWILKSYFLFITFFHWFKWIPLKDCLSLWINQFPSNFYRFFFKLYPFKFLRNYLIYYWFPLTVILLEEIVEKLFEATKVLPLHFSWFILIENIFLSIFLLNRINFLKEDSSSHRISIHFPFLIQHFELNYFKFEDLF